MKLLLNEPAEALDAECRVAPAAGVVGRSGSDSGFCHFLCDDCHLALMS